MNPSPAVIRAEPDGYDVSGSQLMGRHAAGHGFLRAAVAARGDAPLYGLAAKVETADAFRALVTGIDPAAAVEWIPTEQLQRVGERGVLYLADASVALHSRLRQRAGLAAFSLCGVTHTTASLGIMDQIAGLLREPVAPWDALVCTSSAVAETVRRILEAEAEQLRWRFGAGIRLDQPQLPVIPLGIHCDDFAPSSDARQEARAALGLQEDEFAALFVGRLVFHAKAHPYPMLRALQLAAERTGRRMSLILCGWFPSADIEAAFRTGAAAFAPDVRLVVADGRDPVARGRAWAAGDVFLSLSDSIQETFGLTPVEAMAAGLPVIVSDWNGYKDTVRHGVDGFRVRTWAPAVGAGDALARAHQAGAIAYDEYCWLAAASTAVDIGEVASAVCELAARPDLRRRMGAAGQERARGAFDWRVVYGQYRALWGELNARRIAATQDPAWADRIAAAPRIPAANLDPFHAFGHYPTALVRGDTRLALEAGASAGALAIALDHPLFGGLVVYRRATELLLGMLAEGDLSPNDAAKRCDVSVLALARAAGLLLKLGLARIS